MAQSTPAGVTIFYDDSGGTPVDITADVLTINGIEVENLTEDVSGFGTAYDKVLPIGKEHVSDIVLGGVWDDRAGGPDALFKRSVPETPSSITRTLTVTYKAGKSTAIETFMGKYVRSPDNKELMKFEVTLKPTGARTEV